MSGLNLKQAIGYLILAALILPVKAMASPTTISYQGRIVTSDGRPLEYASVSFLFQVMNMSGSCVLYEEQLDGFNMVGSKGVFDTAVGAGTRLFPTSGSASLIDVFNNTAVAGLPCKGGANFIPSLNDVRRLRVFFHDGNGWKQITPDNIVRSVPFAAFAFRAAKLGSFGPEHLLAKTDIPQCGADTFLSWDGNHMTCEPVSGSAGGTVTGVSSTNSYLTVANGTAAASLTLHVGTSANTVAAGNDVRFSDARTPMGTAGGDLSDSYPNPKVVKIQGVAVNSAAPSDGQFLKFASSAWRPASLAISDVAGLSTALNGVVLQSQFPGSCYANQTLTFLSPSGAFTCSDILIDGNAFANQSAGVVLAGPTSGSAKPTFRALQASDLPAAVTDAAWTADSGHVYRASGNVGIGTVAPSAMLHVVGAPGQPAALRLEAEAVGGGVQTRVATDTAAQSGNIALHRSRGTLTSPTYAQNGDQLGVVTIRNHTNNMGATMRSLATENHSTSTAGANLRFDTIPNGSNTAEARMLIDHNGNVGIGTTNPLGPLHISSTGIVYVDRASAVASEGPGFILRASRGTTSVPTVSQNGDYLGKILFDGYDGAAYQRRAQIHAVASGVISANTIPTDLVFSTGGASLNEVMRINASGNVGIGTLAPTTKLEVAGTIKATSFEGPMSATTSSTGAGSAAAPSMTFSGDNDTGFYNASSNDTISVATGGANIFNFSSLGLVSLTPGGASVSTAAGTEAAPTFSFSGDTDTGWFSPGADTLAASTGGAERVRIDAAGSIGIGTTTPGALLHAVSTVSTKSAGNFVTPVLLSDSIWNRALEVNGSSSDTGDVMTTNQVARMAFATGNNQRAAIESARDLSNGYNGYLAFRTRDNATAPYLHERMRIAANGNVGIGTTNPEAALHISAEAVTPVVLMESFNNSFGAPGYAGRKARGTRAFPSAVLAEDYLFNMGGRGYGASAFSATSRGLFGIKASENWTDTTQGTAIVFETTANGTTTRNERLRIADSGNVGIGTSNPSARLHVSDGKAVNASLITTDRQLISGEGEASGSAILVAGDSAGHRPVFKGTRARGTLGTPTAPAVDDQVLSFLGAIFDGTQVQGTALIDFKVDGAVSSGVAPQRISFSTSATNGASRVERLTIKSNGNVGVGTISPQTTFYVEGTKDYSGATPNFSSFDFTVGTWGAGGIALGRYAGQPAVQGMGTGTSYGLHLNPAAGNVYLAGGGGNVGIGTSNPVQKFHVAGNQFATVTSEVASSSDYPALLTLRSRGTLSSKTIVNSGDVIGSFQAAGYDGAVDRVGGYVRIEVDGTPGANDMPGAITFGTTLDGAGTPSEKMRITNGGNVGIGIANPNSKLEVAGTGHARIYENGALRLYRPSTSVSHAILTAASDTGGVETSQFTVRSNGFVGVGISVPTSKLHVDGPGYVEMKVGSGGASNSGLSLTPASGNQFSLQASGTDDSLGASNFYIRDVTANAARLLINPNGNVGIGTTTPTSKLQVAGSIEATGITIGGVPVATSTDTYWSTGGGGMIHYSSGNVGIGTNSPSYLLDVNGMARISSHLVMGSTTMGIRRYFNGGIASDLGLHTTNGDLYLSTNGTSGGEFIIKDNGNVGIGTTAPDEKFVVYNGSTYGRYQSTGWMHSSDERLKEDIQPLENSLTKILQLQGVEYKFKSDKDHKTQVGFIAQKVEPVFPEVVTTDAQGFKSMAYANIVAPLLEAVKEIYQMLQGTNAEVEKLKAENQDMKQALCELGKTRFCQAP